MLIRVQHDGGGESTAIRAKPSADMLEDPADAGAARRGGAGDDELFGRVRAAFAVDPQAFLDRERALGRAELPQRPAGDAQQAAQSVGGQAGRNMGPQVETQTEALVALERGRASCRERGWQDG